jgi:hypothetical protein
LLAAPGSVPVLLAFPNRDVLSVHDGAGLSPLTSIAGNDD